MGNCCSGDHSNPENQTELPLEAEERESGLYDHPSPSEAMVSTATEANPPFLRTPDTMAMESDMEKSFLLQKSLSGGDHQTTTTTSSTSCSPSKEEGEKALLFNPRLIPLLEFFSHLYARKEDLFKRVISVHGEDLVEVLKKVGQVEERMERPRIQMVQRSRSAGAGEPLNNERFKMVKTFKPDEGQPPGGQSGTGSGETKPGGGGGGGGGGSK